MDDAALAIGRDVGAVNTKRSSQGRPPSGLGCLDRDGGVGVGWERAPRTQIDVDVVGHRRRGFQVKTQTTVNKLTLMETCSFGGRGDPI